jgi:peptidyl-prolyl cis-trans isomerase A (cyclophilin A)
MSASFARIEALESRTLFDATLVRLATNYGNIDLQLTDDVTPITVQNFLNYVNSGRFKNTIFHRNSGAVIQGGGFTSTFDDVATDPPIVNEFQAGVTTNIRGTIGMAKSSDPNSATSQFFINLSDNSSSFDNPLNAGGFTAFGSVTVATLGTVDTIAGLPVSDQFAAPFGELPLVNYSGVGNPKPANLVVVKSAAVLGEFTNTITMGDGGVKVVTFTDADGTFTTVRLRGATGTLVFNGTNVFQSTRNGKAVFTGDGMSIASLNYASTGAAVLNVSAFGGNGSVDLPAVSFTGSTTQILAPRANLTGLLTGDALGNLVLGSINGGSVVSNGAALAMKLRVPGGIADGDVTTPGHILSINTGNWTDSTGSASVLSAASVGSLVVPGTMAADVTLSGTGTVLNLARLGSSTGGTWTLAGNAGRVIANAFTGGFTANTASLIKITSLSNASLSFVKAFDGITPALGKLSAGTISGSSIRSTDHIGVVTAGAVDGSIISAGINFAADSVSVPGDFLAAARITSFKSGTFNNSALIAQHLGQALLGSTSDTAPTRPFFGVAADTILTLKLSAPGGNLFLKSLDDPAVVAGLIAAQNVTLSNLQVRVV